MFVSGGDVRDLFFRVGVGAPGDEGGFQRVMDVFVVIPECFVGTLVCFGGKQKVRFWERD
ncbi:hypothetical protein AOE01nite_09190 [Acetobacter oeni]|uniref:Uncharacterized protein n=1 Tax=Acetobacter oeni TaxID=304077 RepID=A0A511XIB4_9PROT|nr:hypothetical protein [Acetobacter oeni]GEN62695.1 hypothetical protein AOE01nite_09190 [Acetobacter oeni]